VDEQYRFVSDASHELKTPITAIKTTLEVALRDKELSPKESRETLVTSLEEVDRLQKLAEGLLALTKISGSPTLSPNNLAKIVTEAVTIVRPLSQHKNIKIVVKVPDLLVQLEPSGMTRAIVAILDNAIKYSQENSVVKVRTKILNKTIQLVIADPGKGIDAKDLPFIFDRFYRADLARTTTGYGLGLSIARQIVEDQKGTIEVSSKLGKGCTVIITLPYSAKLQ
jgi:signal transduction histidine kinase